MKPLRIGFATIYSWRPHVEHAYFLARLVEKAGHEAFFLTCDSDLPTCYTREMRDRPAWQECLQCRAGGIRSYTRSNITSIGESAPRDAAPAQPDWTHSSASTLGRFESDADYAGSEFKAIAARLHPAVQLSYQAARAWICDQKLDAVCVFNGRMDATRAIYEAAKSLGVRVVSLERTWFGDGLQLYPEETCLGLGSVHRLIGHWRELPLTGRQAVQAASYVARRFLRQNVKEWRAYNVGATSADWPVKGGRHKILLIPSSRNEVWGHPDWEAGWADPLAAYDALIDHLGLEPRDLLLRCHPNWGEKIGRQGGEYAERHYVDWAARRGIQAIPSTDDVSTLGLIDQCDAIVVANGSAALEAGALGKQVIGIAPSIYQEAGFRNSAASARELTSLQLHVDLEAAEQTSLRESISRLTLRFAYTMVHRVPQYTQFVRADATTRFKYDMSADPQRFIELLRGGELRADDEECADDTRAEDEVLQRIERRDWQGLLDALERDTRVYEPVRRRLLFRPIDNIRQWMPLGDR
ncbi:hypothetical protein QTH89_23700 [Variovorax sp. J22G21]|uniref:hypothetical protein n=1 Tax=Variovorax fucosicus TaxID=3053517 RepID=UPI002578CC8E|nr:MULTISPECIES: hypothetical protein [unclassified Variovorax]MDM0039464.1 hypothetical protein [Variovorax sp. J22R193]MDM0064239.1 hypothetical protein [Variovorax sp. J22G21]